MKTQNYILKGLFWKFSERLLVQLVAFTISIILARLLSPKDYGVIALVNIFIMLANTIATTGFSSALIQNKNYNSNDFSTLFYCSFIISLILYCLIFFCAPLLSNLYNLPELTPILRVLSLQLPIAAYNSILNAWLAHKMNFKISFLATLIANIISGALGLYLAYNGFAIWTLVYQTLCYLIISTLILSILINWYPSLNFSVNRAKSLMSYGWKVLLADLSGTIFSQLSIFIIGKYYTLSDLAFFNRGKQFPELITYNIDAPITSVLFPAMSKFSNQPHIIKELTRKSIRFTTFLLAPLMLGLIAIAHPLIELLLTNKWLPAVPYLQLICVERLFATLNSANMQSIKALGRSDILLKLEFIKKPIYLIIIVIAAFYSVLAIAIAIACYGFIALLINSHPNKKLLNYSILEQAQDTYLSFIHAILMLVSIHCLTFFIKNSSALIFSQIALGIFVYTLLSFSSKKSVMYELINFLKSNTNHYSD